MKRDGTSPLLVLLISAAFIWVHLKFFAWLVDLFLGRKR